jgi:N-acetylneuraminic acid mutarotase
MLLFLLSPTGFWSISMPTFKKLETTGVKPSKRTSSVTASIGETIYCFGGLYDNFGGKVNTFYNDLFKFNTKNHHWEELQPEGAIPAPRGTSMGLTDKENNKFYIFGGVDYPANFDLKKINMMNDLWVYSPDTNKWEEIKQNKHRPSPRAKSRLWLANNKIYLFGGAGFSHNTFKFLNDMWVYDIATNEWAEIIHQGHHNSPQARDEAYAGLSPSSEGKLTIYAGEGAMNMQTHRNLMLNDTWQFDLKTNKWTDITNKIKDHIFPPRGIGSGVTIGDKLYIHGGTYAGIGFTPLDICDAPFPQRAISNEIWCFDQVHHTWKQIGATGDGMPRIKRHAACEADGKMYILAGFDYIWFGGTPEHELFGNGPGQVWNEEIYCFEP